ALKAAYEKKVVPSEMRYLYSEFDTPPLRDQEFMGKPTILLLGQYSVGKTSMISYLLNGNYPGADIGPEPTTDIFAHVDYSEKAQTISGITLASDPNYQFQSLSIFGDVFLNKLKATRFSAPLLKHISIIDTPGILTGDKQVENRGYDFAQVIKFLSSKVDYIFLLFDANKLDISDEYKQVIQILEGNEDKIKIILNKADWVSPRELVHVRGALMWALGKIMRCPEVPKVFIGSFWPYWSNKNTLLRDAIKEDLTAVVKEIADLPNSYHRRRVNDVAKRARNVGPTIIVRIHGYVMDEIMRRKLFFTKTSTATDTETQPHKLRDVYKTLAINRRIVLNDFPDPELFHKKAKKTKAKDWARIDYKLEKLLNSFIENDISSIANAAINEKECEVKFRVPKKVPLPEDYNKLVKSKKLPEFLAESSQNQSLKDEKKLSEKDYSKGKSAKQSKDENVRSKNEKDKNGKNDEEMKKHDKATKSSNESNQKSKQRNVKSEKNSKSAQMENPLKSSKHEESSEMKSKDGSTSLPKIQENNNVGKVSNQKEAKKTFA
uniref:Dynamin-type G domain-containing protein n=1 Tax=Loa loa TaxID=7209 RepID=A0A1I7W3Q1_LOALO